MKRINLFLIILTLLWSCKKTKLEGELSVLIGSWEWKNTLYTGNFCEAHSDTVITHSPTLDGFTYTLKFIKKGKLEVYINGKKDKTYRLIGGRLDTDPGVLGFSFYLDNKKKSIILEYLTSNGKMYLESNSLPLNILNGFDGCRAEYSVFEKVD